MKNKFFITAIIILLITTNINAQLFEFDDLMLFDFSNYTEGGAIHIDNDGNIIAAGITDTIFLLADTLEANSDMFVIKFDSLNNIVWAKIMDSYYTNSAISTSITTDSDNNIYVTGFYGGTLTFPDTTFQGYGYDIFLASWDKDGNYRWARTARGTSVDYSYSVATDFDNNVYITGWQSPNFEINDSIINNSCFQAFLIKYNQQGDFKWINSFGGDTIGTAYDICIDNNEIALIGRFIGKFSYDTTIVSKGWENTMYVRFNTNGDYLFAKTFEGYNAGYSITIDDEGNVYLYGTFAYTLIIDNYTLISLNDIDGFIAKINENNQIEWLEHLSSNSNIASGKIQFCNQKIYATVRLSSKPDYKLYLNDTIVNMDDSSAYSFVIEYTKQGKAEQIIYAKSTNILPFRDFKVSNHNQKQNIYIIGNFKRDIIFQGLDSIVINDTTNPIWDGGTYIIKYSKNIVDIKPIYKPEIKIFPNPTTGLFYITITDLPVTSFFIEIYNIKGQLILQDKIKTSALKKQFDISAFPKGVYIINIQTNKFNFSKSILKI